MNHERTQTVTAEHEAILTQFPRPLDLATNSTATEETA